VLELEREYGTAALLRGVRTSGRQTGGRNEPAGLGRLTGRDGCSRAKIAKIAKRAKAVPKRLRGVAPFFGAGLFVSDEVSPAACYLAGTEGGPTSLRSIAAGQRPRSFAARASCNHSSASLSHASLSSGLIAFSASLRHSSAKLRNLSASVSRIAPE
jgi:hypothetical protein